MDKHEYRIKSDEIKVLIRKRDFFKAVKIADEIDWTRVRSVAMLCTVSDLYKVNRRYKESKELLLMAYERHPGGRMILYSLCELCIKMGEVVQAIEYYKEFVQLAPMDNGKYILQYKLYEAQEVSLEERIAVLEELKKRDYREKWGYELAYLYHRIGLGTKCVEECDQLILWFREGRYVKKAMELKMLHEPLTPAQQSNYENLMGGAKNRSEEGAEEAEETEEVQAGTSEPEIQVQPMKVGQYDTINLQKALAESMKEVLAAEAPSEPEARREEPLMGEVTSQIMAPMFDTREGFQEVFFEEGHVEVSQELEPQAVPEEPAPEETEPPVSVKPQPVVSAPKERAVGEITKEIPSIKEIMSRPLYETTQQEVPREMAGYLSQEYDGQISLVMPEEMKVEKQITGQMSIEDVLLEWEKSKKELEEKRKEELTRKVLEQTGSMFTDFEAKIKDGILAQLEEPDPAGGEKGSRPVAETIREHLPVEEEEFPEVEELTEIEELQEAEDPTQLEELQEAETQAELEELRDAEAPTVSEEQIIPEKAEEVAPEAVEEQTAEEQVPETAAQVTAEATEETRRAETVRDMTEEEKALFGSFIQTKGARRRFLQALDEISLAAYTGNVIITGEADMETVNLAKNVIKDIQMSDSNFSGIVAKVAGSSLNSKNIENTIGKLNNGGLIIEKASGMNSQAVTALLKALNQEQTGIVVILEDNKKAMKRMLAAYPALETFFTARMEIEELSNDALAAYGRQYALHLEYAIDELGMLALQTKIEDRQTSDHIVTVAEVRELVDDAIAQADKKNLKHFFDLILGNRYDEEDMIVLREKDFI